jgi:signal transduction histidine kinase
MAILWRALRQEADLRRRQQNFLAAVSHELRSPIASLQLTTETLARRQLEEPKRHELLRRSLEDLERLSRLVGNLIASARFEEQRVRLERSRVLLVSAVDVALDDLERAGRDTTRVEIVLEPGLAVFADATGVATVVRNLLENALEATTPDAAVRVLGAVRDGWVVLRVEDDGVGFEPHQAERLFEKFYRPGDELRRSSRGTGLGLYLVRSFVGLEGGKVTASSAGAGAGAIFEVRWPLPKGDPAGVAPSAGSEPRRLELRS